MRPDGSRTDPTAEGGRSTFVIFNPAAGRRRGRRLIRRYQALLDEHLPRARSAFTSGPGDEVRLVDRALDEGCRTIVAAGGDGTWSHVADRILSSGVDDVRLGILPAGTGNDFGRSLGVPHRDPAGAVRILGEGADRLVDAGRIRTPSAPAGSDGDPTGPPRHFLNVVGFGFDVAVIRAAEGARFLRGELLYKVTALQQLFRFPGFEVEVAGAGEPLRGRHLLLTISNGRYFGGGFPIAPGATVEDGLLHACAVADAPPLARYRLFNLAEKGAHTSSAEVRLERSSRFRVRFDAPPSFEVDGDVFRSGSSEVEVELLPGRLRVVAPMPPRS